MTKTKSKKNMIKRNKMDEKQEKEQLTMKANFLQIDDASKVFCTSHT